ncbi:hypothetical protein [Dehalococcoides mccartyi]|uniref:Uncharacterized protein n=1 Tax=Dehalococcoides mccartyi (strain VS) TaxID=311424 RepID=D2BGF1_DEHMV|nr:hypothetical protein [Dehalococcoides mccartyi]ACZ61401.1 hypothetical protein DhcVS_239 [Dehalococcoides mccartyi VS]
MVLDITLEPMALEQKTFNVGDTVRVTVSFKYTVGVNKTVKLSAGPYYTNLFGKHLVASCVGDADVQLVPASSPATQSATVDFTLIPKANNGIDNGTYGLRVWVEDTNAVAEQDDVIVVTGNPGSTDMFSSMMPMIMMLLMMGMVMPMVQQTGEGVEE